MLRFETLPRAVRATTVAAVGWRNRIARYGGEYRSFRRFLQESRDWPTERVRAWQQEELRRLLKSVVDTTPRYTNLRTAIDAATGCTELPMMLACLPPLYKKELREHPDGFVNTGSDLFNETSTSGSTGAPMRVGHSRGSVERRFALLNEHVEMLATTAFDPTIRLSGRILADPGRSHRRPWLFNPAENQVFVSTYHLNNEHAPALAKLFDGFQPVLIDGYPSAIANLLRLVTRAGGDTSRLAGVITTAETLLPDLREEIERLTGKPVLDYYAASEGVPLIQQCPYGTYHVRWQSGIFEVYENGEYSSHGTGELVATSFVQKRTPLIRYHTGDLLEELTDEAEQCECGLRTATVKQVTGRIEDMVVARSGRSLGMFAYRTLKTIADMGETQIIQKDVDRFVVHTVLRDGVDPGELGSQVQSSFERALGYPITLELVPVAAIPRGASGKIRLVISEVKRP